MISLHYFNSSYSDCNSTSTCNYYSPICGL